MPKSTMSQPSSRARLHREGSADASRRGFAHMNWEQQREIAHRGGVERSRDALEMAKVGRKGGINSGKSKRLEKWLSAGDDLGDMSDPLNEYEY